MKIHTIWCVGSRDDIIREEMPQRDPQKGWPRPIPFHLVELLRTCRERNSTETKVLTQQLGLSAATVNVYFQRIAEALGTTDRFSSVQKAFRLGLLTRHGNNLLINGDFTEGIRGLGPGNSLPWTALPGWTALGRATPQWIEPEGDEPGAVMMWGAADTGEAIYQQMPPAHRLLPGRTYRFSAEYRFGHVRRDWPTVPRQPMFVDFVIRASQAKLSSYTAPDAPGAATLGRLHYARREPSGLQSVIDPPTPEQLETLRQIGGIGGEHAVQDALATFRAGGHSFWEWEWGALPDWTADAEYDTLTIHPTNDLVVGTDGSNLDAPLELAWGQIRRVQLVEVKPEE
jgi:hypothetical protein